MPAALITLIHPAFAIQVGNVPASWLDDNYQTILTALNSPATYTNPAQDIGTLNNLVIQPVPPPVAITKGLTFYIIPANTNTGATNLQIQQVGGAPIGGNVAIQRPNLAALSANDIIANSIVAVTFNGTNWILQTGIIQTFSQSNSTIIAKNFYWD